MRRRIGERAPCFWTSVVEFTVVVYLMTCAMSVLVYPELGVHVFWMTIVLGAFLQHASREEGEEGEE